MCIERIEADESDAYRKLPSMGANTFKRARDAHIQNRFEIVLMLI